MPVKPTKPVSDKYTLTRGQTEYLYTKGGEFSLDGVEYIGEYHLVGPFVMTGPIKAPNARHLEQLYTSYDHYIYDKSFNFGVGVKDRVDPTPFRYTPTDQSYVAGSEMRFFVEKINTDDSFAFEINRVQYDYRNRPGGVDEGIYALAAIEWKLTGRLEDIITFNQIQMERASEKLPTIAYAVTSFSEYARVTLV
jgi:hypothetical protein